jgi:hypothetical protein
MTRRTGLSGLLLALLLLAMAGSVYAAVDTTTLTRAVFGSAGQEVAAGDIVLNGTLGEAVTGPLVVTGDVQEGSGFWQKIPPWLNLYLPQVRQ